MVVVKWSVGLPSLPTTQVWITPKPTVFSVKFVLQKNKIKQRAADWPSLKNSQHWQKQYTHRRDSNRELDCGAGRALSSPSPLQPRLFANYSFYLVCHSFHTQTLSLSLSLSLNLFHSFPFSQFRGKLQIKSSSLAYNLIQKTFFYILLPPFPHHHPPPSTPPSFCLCSNIIEIAFFTHKL